MECMKEKNLANCNCTSSCAKKGICCLCISHHRENNELPACYFSAAGEKTYDRSIENFIRMYKQR